MYDSPDLDTAFFVTLETVIGRQERETCPAGSVERSWFREKHSGGIPGRNTGRKGDAETE